MILWLWIDVLLLDAIGCLPMERLESLESSLHLAPGEGVVAREARPLIIVVPGAHGVDAKVDGAASTEPLATRVVDFTIPAVLLRGCLVAPVHFLLHVRDPSLPVNAEVSIRILAARLQQQNRRFLGRQC